MQVGDSGAFVVDMKKDGAPEYVMTARHTPYEEGEKKQLLQMAEVNQVMRQLLGKKEDKFKTRTAEEKKTHRLKVTMRSHARLPPTPFLAQHCLPACSLLGRSLTVEPVAVTKLVTILMTTCGDYVDDYMMMM